MSFRAALSALFSSQAPEDPKTDKRNELSNSIFTNGRTIIIVGFVALLIWNVTKQMLTGESLKMVGELVKLYLIIEGAIHLVTVICNAVIKVMELKAFMADGKLDDNEEDVLEGKGMTATATLSVPGASPSA